MTETISSPQLEKISSGHYLLKGQLSFTSVPQLWLENRQALFADEAETIAINMSQIERSDSSGLALLIEWYREAEKQNKKIRFFDLPKQMYAIAHISGLNDILPLMLTESSLN